jgi:GntR family transcriptional regulator
MTPATPLYQQLASELGAEIERGTYPPGQRIPSEHALAARFGVARPTARQATDVLVAQGLLERRRGSGTYVRSVPLAVDLFSFGGTFASFEASGVSLDVRLVSATKAPGAALIQLVRVSRAFDQAVLLEELDFDARVFPGLEEAAQGARSLSALVEGRYGQRPEAVEQAFRVERLGEARARLLEAEADDVVLRVDRALHFPLAGAAVHARMFCREGRFVFSQRIGGNSHG